MFESSLASIKDEKRRHALSKQVQEIRTESEAHFKRINQVVEKKMG